MSYVITFEDYQPPPRADGVAWTMIQIEEALTPTGTWSVIETVDLDPVDADPTNPSSRTVTTTNATGVGLYYRLTALDGGGNRYVFPVVHQGASTVAFATPDDLAARLGVTLTESEQARAEILLALASGLVQSAARQDVGQVVNDTLTRCGTRESTILLPERPVTAVGTVTLDGQALTDGVDFYREDDELVRAGGWGCPADLLTIVYTHGFDPIPDAIRGVVLEAVVRVWVNPGSVMAERYGSEQVTYLMGAGDTVPTGLLLTKVEQQTVRSLTRRGARSMSVR